MRSIDNQIIKKAITNNSYQCNVCKSRDHADYMKEQKDKLAKITISCRTCADVLMEYYERNKL